MNHPQHGRHGYWRGCRCQQCRDDINAYNREVRAAKAARVAALTGASPASSAPPKLRRGQARDWATEMRHLRTSCGVPRTGCPTCRALFPDWVFHVKANP